MATNKRQSRHDVKHNQLVVVVAPSSCVRGVRHLVALLDDALAAGADVLGEKDLVVVTAVFYVQEVVLVLDCVGGKSCCYGNEFYCVRVY